MASLFLIHNLTQLLIFGYQHLSFKHIPNLIKIVRQMAPIREGSAHNQWSPITEIVQTVLGTDLNALSITHLPNFKKIV